MEIKGQRQMMGQDRVEEVLVIRALQGLRKSRRIDYTISKEKPFRGCKPRVYRVIKS